MRKRGFTLIELMTAISIFIIVMTVSMGSILGVFDANRKSRALKTLVNNLSLAVGSMSKEIRYGRNYHCGSVGTLTDPRSCLAGASFISFLSSEGVQISYRFQDQTIQKRIADGAFIEVTAPEIIIDDLVFYVIGAEAGDNLQPKVLIRIRSHTNLDKVATSYFLQTMVSQRVRDL